MNGCCLYIYYTISLALLLLDSIKIPCHSCLCFLMTSNPKQSLLPQTLPTKHLTQAQILSVLSEALLRWPTDPHGVAKEFGIHLYKQWETIKAFRVGQWHDQSCALENKIWQNLSDNQEKKLLAVTVTNHSSSRRGDGVLTQVVCGKCLQEGSGSGHETSYIRWDVCRKNWQCVEMLAQS